MTSPVSVKLRELVKDIYSGFRGNGGRDDVRRIEDALDEVCCLIGVLKTPKNSSRFDKGDQKEAKLTFISVHFAEVLDIIIANFNAEWISYLNPSSRALLDDVFLKGPEDVVFISLCNNIAESNPGYKVNKCCSYLEKFIAGHGICRLLVNQCVNVNVGQTILAQEKERWDNIVSAIASVPDRVTNKLRKETSDIFYPQAYIPLVVADFLNCSREVQAAFGGGKDCSIGVLSNLLGKLCLVGHGDVVWTHLLRQWIPVVSKDPLLQRLVHQLIVKLPDKYAEATITPFLRHCPWYGTVKIFLGHGVLDKHKLKFLLTTKLMFMRHFDNEKIQLNIIGYLASLDILKPTFLSLVRKLLEVWSDSSAIKHTSYEQHLYLSKSIIISMAFMKGKENLLQDGKDFLLSLLMPGVQHHLDSSVDKVRRLGMIVAEQVTQTANLSPDNVLKFEYPTDGETERLLALAKIPEDPGLEEVESILKSQLNLKDGDIPKGSKLEDNAAKKSTSSDSELDSDDDLQPYDMSHDKTTKSVKPPMYVRECMDGLINNEEPDKVEVSLQTAEKLIRAHPSNAREIAVEFCKILLHLDNNYSLFDFVGMRHKAIVALCVVSPIPVAEYLSDQFYERNYNLRQRMDMLDVLGASAQEISGLNLIGGLSTDQKPKISIIHDNGVVDDEDEPEPQDWKAVVQKRIDSKTRIISRGRTQPEPKVVVNKFADKAGHFFFSLLGKFDKAADRTFDLMGDDHILLSHLFYTLGRIMYSASNCLIVRQMAKALIEFVWMTRFHPQQGVRQSLLYTLSMLALATPGHVLLTDLRAEMYELKDWLEHTAQKDESAECQKMAVQVLILLEKNVKSELEGATKT